MAEDSLGKLHWQDILVITAYFLGVLIVGLWSARKANRSSISGYFLAGRSMHWIPVGASLFASNIGSGHFVGLAGSGAATGIGTAVFEFNALFVLLLLGWLFIPVYMASGVYTMPEYLKKRFGGQRIQIYLSVLALILYVFTKISADLFAGALFIEQSLELNMYVAIIILLAIAALFTITGGLTAVIWTDFVQTILMLVGAFILMFFSFNKVGGYEAVIDLYKTAEVDYLQNLSEAKQQCGRVKEDAMHLIRHPSSPDFPWTGVIFGLTVSAVWYWCSDQVIVQRALAAKNLTHAKAGTMLAGYLKILPLFILVFPGMIARILYKDIVACATPEKCKEACNNEGGCTNIAYATLVLDLMPNGLRGMMLAVMLAALMSSLTSIFNSSSTIFTMDIWTRIRKKASDTELLIVGRLFVLILVAISIIWIPVIKKSQGSQLFVYIQSITSYLSPPVCAVYVLAIFWTRTNEKGAFWSLMIGLCIGVIRFVLEFSFPTPPCGSEEIDSRPEFIKQAIDKVHYLHFGILLFIISAICCITISLLTKPIDEKHLHRLTFWSRHSTEVRVNIDEDTKEETTINSVSKECEEAIDKQKSTDQLTTEETDESSVLKKLYYFICGIQRTTINSSEAPVKKLSREDEAREAAESLIEDPFWEKVCNINAVAVLMIAAFIWGYYA